MNIHRNLSLLNRGHEFRLSVFVLACIALLRLPLGAHAQQRTDSVGVPVSYSLPIDGTLPRVYRVTLAITAPNDPNWILSTFVSGAVREVTKENGGRFSEIWDGLDDNFMPVPPGEYGVRGISMPAEIWTPDGKPHTLRARYFSGPNTLMPRPGRQEQGPFITGDQAAPGIGDIAVGPDGVAIFYWKFLENAQNAYRVDLNLPPGPEQLLGGFGSGGTGGGNYATTDGKTIWCVAPTDKMIHLRGKEGLFIYPPFLYRTDEKPFGSDNMIRRNVTLTSGLVTGLAAWRSKTTSPALLFVAERGKMAVVDQYNNLDIYAESPSERINLLRCLDGDTAAELSRLPVAEPTALVVANNRLYLMEKREADWTVRHAELLPDGKLEAVTWSVPTTLAGLRDPRDLAVDSQGRYYVADPGLNQVLRFAANGKLERKPGRLERQPEGGYDPNSFMEPTRVVCWRDKKGAERLLVAESGGPSRVTEWTTDGNPLRDWGYSLGGNGGFAVDPELPEHLYLYGANHTLLRYRVDYGSGEWTLEKVWHGIDTTGLTYPEIINHAGHKYLSFKRLGQGVNLWRFAGDRLLPSAGILREGKQGDPKTKFFVWHDANGNGVMDEAERRPLEMPRGLDRYFGDYRQDDLSLLVPRGGTPDLYRLPVGELDAHGNPIHGDWQKVLTDEIYAAKAAGTATAIHGGNEAVSAFNGDWGSARQTSTGDIVVNMRGGGFSANHGWQQRLSRYVPDGQTGFRQKWRVGRSANIVPEPHGVHGSINVTKPLLGLIGMIDQSRAGVHVYDWESGLYVDTLMLPGEINHEVRTVYNSPGEFFVGAAHEAGGKVYVRWGKTNPTLFEVDGWSPRQAIRAVAGLPGKVAITAAQIASPPELALQVRGGSGAAKVAAFQPLPGAGPTLDGSRAGWEGCQPVVFGDDAARIEVRCGYNPETLFLRWEVRAAHPTSVPPLPSPERIFTHDRAATTLGFYLQGDAAAQGKASEGRPGDIRIVFGLYEDSGQLRAAALGMYPRWDDAGKATPFLYISPGQQTPFAHVALLDTVKLSHALSDDRKTLVMTAAIPRAVLPGKVPRLADGWRTMANFDANIGGSHKLWWSNADGTASRETNDEPTEARLYPGAWGQATFAPLSGGLPIRAWLINGPWKADTLNYTGTADNKRQFQQHFDDATFPPDSRLIGRGDIASQPPAEPGQWSVLNARPIDNCLYPDDGRGLHANGCNLYFAANWIWAPEATEVTLELPQQSQNNLRVWLNDTQLAETADEQGLYHKVSSPQKLTLQPGWNHLFLRAYALGYDLHFGAILKADAAQLWRLRLSATPQDPRPKN